MRSTGCLLVIAASFALLAAPLAGSAQPTEKAARVGWVGFNPTAKGAPRAIQLEGFRAAMRERGWVEGKNLVLDVRAGAPGDAAGFAKELLGAGNTVIVASGPMVGGIRAHAGATPIVFAMTGNPVDLQWVAALARPGGSLTGVSGLALELEGKRLALLKEIKPAITRVAVLANARHPGYGSQLKAAQAAAQQLGFVLQSVQVRAPGDFEAAFEAIAQGGAEAIVAFPDGLIERQATLIAAFAEKRRIPSIGGFGSFVEAGNLLSYGPSEKAFYGRTAHYVDRILRGAKAEDLPVELPSTFELTLNRKVATAIGVVVPPSVLLRVDRLVE